MCLKIMLYLRGGDGALGNKFPLHTTPRKKSDDALLCIVSPRSVPV